eukprot:SAG31_NODE_26212_length_446_cov_0.884726_2_plen_41_part_01
MLARFEQKSVLSSNDRDLPVVGDELIAIEIENEQHKWLPPR